MMFGFKLNISDLTSSVLHVMHASCFTRVHSQWLSVPVLDLKVCLSQYMKTHQENIFSQIFNV